MQPNGSHCHRPSDQLRVVGQQQTWFPLACQMALLPFVSQESRPIIIHYICQVASSIPCCHQLLPGSISLGMNSPRCPCSESLMHCTRCTYHIALFPGRLKQSRSNGGFKMLPSSTPMAQHSYIITSTQHCLQTLTGGFTLHGDVESKLLSGFV